MKSILLVDDSHDNHVLYQIILANYKLVSATNGADALTELESNQFDLIITDMSMPGMDGVQFIDACLERGIETPIVLSSANHEAMHPQALNLPKPFNIKDLYSVVAKLTNEAA